MTKEIVVFGGGNGSGKTTFAREFLKRYPYPFINADDIAKEVTPENVAQSKVTAGREWFERIKKIAAEEKALAIKSTLSGKSLVRILESLKAQGYRLTIVVLFVETPEVAIERIRG